MSVAMNVATLIVATLLSLCVSNPGVASSSLHVTNGIHLQVQPLYLLDDVYLLDDDVSSFVLTSGDFKSSPSAISSGVVVTHGEANTSLGCTPSDAIAESTNDGNGESPSAEQAAWEASFAIGMKESKALIEAEELRVGSWTTDIGKSGGTIPSQMLVAEGHLQAAEEAPDGIWRHKAAERALQIYYHAKWLAEKNYARAAEYRYREAADLARKCRRSVLASHSLARLGYYLVQWNRAEEASTVLQESIQVNLKSNPLAPFLHGVLERKAAGADMARLNLAEQYILNSEEQPSDELEHERNHLISEIAFWREAEASARNCFASADSALLLICLCTHAAASLHGLFFK